LDCARRILGLLCDLSAIGLAPYEARSVGTALDPSEYRDVALALVSLDVPVGQVKRLAGAVLRLPRAGGG